MKDFMSSAQFFCIILVAITNIASTNVYSTSKRKRTNNIAILLNSLNKKSRMTTENIVQLCSARIKRFSEKHNSTNFVKIQFEKTLKDIISMHVDILKFELFIRQGDQFLNDFLKYFSGFINEITIAEFSSNELAVSKLLSSLPFLEKLNLSHNPDIDFTNLKIPKYLKSLNLSFCQLKRIPDLILRLNELISLNFKYNPGLDITGLNVMNSLKILDLSFCNLRSLQSLANLTNLQEINISGNTNIDFQELAFFTNVQVINIGYCRLFEIPEAIFNLSKLERLIISGNDIQVAPMHLICRLPNPISIHYC